MQVTIPPELAAYVQARVARGDYANLEELVKDSIRLLEKLDTLAQRKLEELRESVQRAAEQLDRGDGVPFTEDVAEDQAAGARTARGLGAEEIGVKPAELSPEARADLDEIWLHVAADSLEAADRLIDDLRAKCDSLSVLPGGAGVTAATSCPALAPCRTATISSSTVSAPAGSRSSASSTACDLPQLLGDDA